MEYVVIRFQMSVQRRLRARRNTDKEAARHDRKGQTYFAGLLHGSRSLAIENGNGRGEDSDAPARRQGISGRILGQSQEPPLSASGECDLRRRMWFAYINLTRLV